MNSLPCHFAKKLGEKREREHEKLKGNKPLAIFLPDQEFKWSESRETYYYKELKQQQLGAARTLASKPFFSFQKSSEVFFDVGLMESNIFFRRSKEEEMPY